MAQLVARFHGMEEVRGSNPLSSTTRKSGPAFAGPDFVFIGRGIRTGRHPSKEWRFRIHVTHFPWKKLSRVAENATPLAAPDLQTLDLERREGYGSHSSSAAGCE